MPLPTSLNVFLFLYNRFLYREITPPPGEWTGPLTSDFKELREIKSQFPLCLVLKDECYHPIRPKALQMEGLENKFNFARTGNPRYSSAGKGAGPVVRDDRPPVKKLAFMVLLPLATQASNEKKIGGKFHLLLHSKFQSMGITASISIIRKSNAGTRQGPYGCQEYLARFFFFFNSCGPHTIFHSPLMPEMWV